MAERRGFGRGGRGGKRGGPGDKKAFRRGDGEEWQPVTKLGRLV